MGRYVSTAEAARIIGCVTSRVRQLLDEKKLVGEKFGRDWLVLKVSAEQYRDTEQRRGFPRGQSRNSKSKKPKRKGKP